MGKIPEKLLNSFKEYLCRLENIADSDGAYSLEAYSFVMSALHFTLKELEESRHLTGGELLRGIKTYAAEQYGPMAHMVFNHWGVHDTLDFGKVVFKLVDAGFMTKTDEDSLDDFRDVYNFKEAFDQPLQRFFDDE